MVRREFCFGSALYPGWNENRADTEPFGDCRVHRDLRAIPGAPSRGVFLVKISYWPALRKEGVERAPDSLSSALRCLDAWIVRVR